MLCRAGAQPGPGATLTGSGLHYCRTVSRLPYLRRDELDDARHEVWDSIVGSRGAAMVNDQGALTGPFNAFVHAPEVGRHLTALGRVLRFETSIARAVGGRHHYRRRPLESRVRMVGARPHGP